MFLYLAISCILHVDIIRYPSSYHANQYPHACRRNAFQKAKPAIAPRGKTHSLALGLIRSFDLHKIHIFSCLTYLNMIWLVNHSLREQVFKWLQIASKKKGRFLQMVAPGCGDPGRNACPRTTDIAQLTAQMQLDQGILRENAC